MNKSHSSTYVICIKNDDYQASLEKRKVYRVVSDKVAEKRGLLRVMDESGESYLYPENHFLSIKLNPTVLKAFAHAA